MRSIINNNMKKNDLLFILTSSCILVAVWIIFSIYHASVSTTINQTIVQEIKPINPKFNTAAVNQIKTRQQITPVYDLKTASSTAINKSVTSTPTQTPTRQTITPTGTISAQVTP